MNRVHRWHGAPQVSTLIIYTLSLAIPFFLENAIEIFDVQTSDQHNILSPVFLYQRAVTAGPRKPRSHFVRMVLIDPKTEPPDVASETSPCKQRAFVARLLRIIAAANPAVIVIDKFYPNDVCNDAETAELKKTIAEIAPQIPILLCAFDRSEYDLQNRPDTKLQLLKQRNAVVVSPTIEFGPAVHHGLKALNSDTRKIPLSWPTFNASDFDERPAEDLSTMRPTLMDTLAVAAVKLYDSTALQQRTIQELTRRGQHPYTSFLTPAELPTSSAIDLLCDSDHAKAVDWRTQCLQAAANSDRLKSLRHRVVIIGQSHSSDMHQTAIGRVPGVVLQANYIESLLDDRYLRPTPMVIQLALSIGWLFIIEWIFATWEPKPLKALAIAALLTVFLWFLTYNIAILQLGRYLIVWPPSAIAMATRFLSLTFKRLQGKATPRAVRTT